MILILRNSSLSSVLFLCSPGDRRLLSTKRPELSNVYVEFQDYGQQVVLLLQPRIPKENQVLITLKLNRGKTLILCLKKKTSRQIGIVSS